MIFIFAAHPPAANSARRQALLNVMPAQSLRIIPEMLDQVTPPPPHIKYSVYVECSGFLCICRGSDGIKSINPVAFCWMFLNCR